jgi:hypothetical protein
VLASENEDSARAQPGQRMRQRRPLPGARAALLVSATTTAARGKRPNEPPERQRCAKSAWIRTD